MRSKHFQKRAAQRAISEDFLQLVQSLGTTYHDGKLRLDRKSIKVALEWIETTRRRLIKAEERGGAVLVIGGNGTYITTYTLRD